MMSENSSSINFMTLQKNIFKRRKWLVMLAFLVFILYNAVFIGIYLTNGTVSDGNKAVQMRNFLGVSGFNRIITIVGAVLLGIEGFHWLDSRVKLDFYESQPFSRNAHFFGVVINSTIIYMASYLISLLLGFVVTGIGHELDGSVISAAFIAYLRNLFLYFSVFSFSVLAIMLTGNIVVAVIADVVLLTYEVIFDFSVNACLGYIVTMTDNHTFSTHGIFSPLSTNRNYMRTGDAIGHNIIMGIVVLFIAWLLYRNRKTEYAGNAVPYKAVRYIAKIAVIFIGCLVSTLVLTDGSREQAGPVCMLIMIISMIVIGGVMETIYTSDVKAVFRGFGYSCIGCAAAFLLFFGCYFDIIGYNHWVPDVSQVDSAYIISQAETDNSSAKYMKLTDIDTLNTLLAKGEENIVSDNKGNEEYCDMSIYYRMKNGKVKGRRVNIPLSCKDDLNRIFSSDEFKKGWFGFYHDEAFRKSAKDFTITYNNADLSNFKSVSYDTNIYNRIKDAYIMDLADYDYDLVSSHVPVGTISIEKISGNVTGDDNDGNTTTYPVYKSFKNTIATLKEAGLYVSTTADPDSVVADMTLPFWVSSEKARY